MPRFDFARAARRGVSGLASGAFAALAALNPAAAGQFTKLADLSSATCAYPMARLTLGPDGAFYSTCFTGGSGGSGVVFKATRDGALTVLHSFSGGDGVNPQAPVTFGPDGTLYGATDVGGAANDGVLFSLAADGSAFRVLADFLGKPGGFPTAGVVFPAHGTAFFGSTELSRGGHGTLFAFDGTAVTTLYNFASSASGSPFATLLYAADGLFYGAAMAGGGARGALYSLSPSGVYAVVHQFSGRDGAQPATPLVEGPGGMLFGMTKAGGAHGRGTVFKTTPSGLLTVLHSFNGADGSAPYGGGGLALAVDGALYGTTYAGGARSAGVIFRIDAGGVYQLLHDFTGYADGATPRGGLTFGPDGRLYGVTFEGGRYGDGVYYSYAP